MTTPTFYTDPMATLYCGDVMEVLSQLPPESVHMVCTSPPYWGLRSYAGNQERVWGGQEGCQHIWGKQFIAKQAGGTDNPFADKKNWDLGERSQGQFCSLCSAWRGAYGLEPTIELYIAHSVEILRAIRRVLRKDGTVWWDIGDSYAGSGKSSGQEKWLGGDKQRTNTGSLVNFRTPVSGLKPKDLCLIPFRLAIALQSDGWWVRSVIIWNKPNPMPESVTDRPTEAHEYILMLAKRAKYYYDQEAVRTLLPESSMRRYEHAVKAKEQFNPAYHKNSGDSQSPMEVLTRAAANVLASGGANLRSVWTINSQPFAGAHFATFPSKLPETCILAGTSEYGVCAKCGSPYARVFQKGQLVPDAPGYKPRGNKRGDDLVKNAMTPAGQTQGYPNFHYEQRTLGWRASCKCGTTERQPAVVLDPFAGSGTTLAVAKALGRKSIGIDISEEYCQLAQKRIESVTLPLSES